MFQFAVAAFYMLCGAVCLLITFCTVVGVAKYIQGEAKKKK